MGYYTKKGKCYSTTTLRVMLTNPKYKGYYCGKKIEIIDYMDAAKALKFSGNNEMVYNPSAISVWLNVDDKKMVEVKGGALVDLNEAEDCRK